jgi:hypothetical protein
VEILEYCFLVVGALFGASLTWWHVLIYQSRMREMTRDMKQHVMMHERIWESEDEKDGRDSGPP